jgi:hypothetical protein
LGGALGLMLAGCLAFGSIALRAEIKIEGVTGQDNFTFDFADVTDFSGITWVKDDLFYVVGNRVKAFMPLRIAIEPATGKILSAKIGEQVPVKTALDDFEGIAWLPERKRFYISTERPPGIVGFDEHGDASFPVEVPKIFENARFNKGFEALAYGDGVLWTCNEDALTVDGPPSSPGSGAWVRLQKFDRKFKPVRQFAYKTDGSLLRVGGGGTGVPDLAVLPNGELLSLERVVGLGLEARIFHVEWKDATDTSELPSLEKAEATPVKKQQLFNRATLTTNYEGIALGPELADGWRSLILISDSAHGTKHYLMPLRIHLGEKPAEEKKAEEKPAGEKKPVRKKKAE